MASFPLWQSRLIVGIYFPLGETRRCASGIWRPPTGRFQSRGRGGRRKNEKNDGCHVYEGGNLSGSLRVMQKTSIRTYKVPEVSPLVIIFPSQDGEWVAWTQSGYYAASPKGDRYIGWHMNRGLDRAADWFRATSSPPPFTDPMWWPRRWSWDRRKPPSRPSDGLRRGTALWMWSNTHRRARILAPQDRITLDAAEESPCASRSSGRNDDPLSEVTVLVNGRAIRKTEGLTRGRVDSQGLEPRQITHELAVPLVPGRNLVRRTRDKPPCPMGYRLGPARIGDEANAPRAGAVWRCRRHGVSRRAAALRPADAARVAAQQRRRERADLAVRHPHTPLPAGCFARRAAG